MADGDYWAALAQVIPVLALALVIEARVVTGRWTVATPRRVRFTLATIWAVTLSMMTFGELTAFRVLRDEMVSPWWQFLTELAIGLALGLLILVPVVEFVTRGNAEGVARLLTGAWIPRLRLALLERSLFHWHRKLHEERHQRWLLLQKAQAVIGQHASSVAELRVLAGDTNDPHVKKVAEEHLGKATFQLADAKQSYADWHRGWRQMIIHELERNRVLREDRMTWRRDLSEALTKTRQRLVPWMLAFNTADAFGGVDPQRETGLIEDVDPDDGGFLPLPQIESPAQ